MYVCVPVSLSPPYTHIVLLLSRNSSIPDQVSSLIISTLDFFVNLGLSCSYLFPDGVYKNLEREPKFQILQELPLWWTLCALLVLESVALLRSYLFLLEWTQDPGDSPDCLLFPLSWICAL